MRQRIYWYSTTLPVQTIFILWMWGWWFYYYMKYRLANTHDVDAVSPRSCPHACASRHSAFGPRLLLQACESCRCPSKIVRQLRHFSKMMSRITALKDLKVLSHQIPAHGLTPNTSIQNKPLLIYRSAFPSNASAEDIEGHLESVGVVSPQWRYTMFTTSHFHVSYLMSGKSV